MDKKFIIVTDKDIAEKMKAYGFQLISQAVNMYTFLNQCPKGFNFDEIDMKKVCYSNILSI